MKRYFIYSFIFLLSTLHNISHAQIIKGKDTLYGNEWIQYNQSYYKFNIDKDALYQLSYNDLLNAGIPITTLNGSQLQIWRFGEEVPVFMNNSNQWNATDKLIFWGIKNRSELDATLFANPAKEMLNPEYSLVSDTAAYYLTWVADGIPTKRINLKTSNALLPSSTFYTVDQLTELHSYPIDKKYDFQNEINLSSFDVCEGFGTPWNNQFTQKLKAENPVSGVQSGYILVRLGTSQLYHILNISINNQVMLRDSFTDYQVKEYKIPISNALLKDEINFKIESKGTGNDYFSVSNIHFVYPKSSGAPLARSENIISNEITSLLNTGNLNDLSIAVPSVSPSTWYSTVLLNNQYLLENPAALNSSYIYAANRNQAIGNIKLSQAIFSPISDDKKTNYLIITHNKLSAVAEEYAAYRRSASGGAFNVQVVDIDQIYSQFGYGMNRHVLGLRNYGQYIYKKWPSLKYVLLFGRSLNYRDLRVDNNISLYGHLDLIPSYGYPGSDNLIFSKTNETVPVFNSGRLAATTPDQVKNYLNKVKEYESKLKNPSSNDDLYWRKRILHLAGGDPVTDGFDRILDGFQTILDSSDYKADITLVKKNSSDPVQGGVSEIVKNLINQGVAIHTYLGHGAISATEIGLDDPEIFDNAGKYPVCFTLGCNSGNMHTTGVSLSESFIFSRKGDIAYLASSGIGTDGGYANYGNILFELLGNTYYNKTISEVHYQALKSFEGSGNFYVRSLNEQLTLHGDPAIQLNYYNAPDLTIDTKTFKTIPQNVLADQDSIRFSFMLWNLGRHTKTPIEYEVSLQLQDGTINKYNFIQYLDVAAKEIHVSIPMPLNAVGNNILNIKIDPNNKINELPQPFAENNNELRQNGTVGVVIPIFNTEAKPAYPADFGIVGESNVELRASTSDAFSNLSTYYFEIDTTALFNSPLLKKASVQQRGGLITWKPALNQQPNKVYYWRIASDTSITHTSFIWNQRSFIYLPDQGPGWNQSHSYQYTQNEKIDLHFDLEKNGWQNLDKSSVVVRSIDHSIDPAEYSKIILNGFRVSRNNRTEDAEFIISIFDIYKGDVIINPITGRDGAKNVFGREVAVFTFPMDENRTEERADLIQFLNTGVKKGQYVILYNHKEHGKSYFPQAWAADSIKLKQNLFQVLESKGAKLIRQLANYDSYPYIFAYEEGGKVIDEAIGYDGLQVYSSFELPKIKPTGTLNSVLIGPASSWEKFEWSINDLRNKVQNTITITGINNLNSETLFSSSSQNINLSSIDPIKYPYLKLEWHADDSSKTSSYNLEHWRVFYKSLSDLAISSNDDFEFYKDTIDQGENIRLRYTIQNIGGKSVDSLVAIYSIIDEQNRIRMDTTHVATLIPGSKKVLSKEISTESRIKNQSLLINIYSLSKDPEVSIRNNTGRLNYFVVADIIPPTVTVLFDGKQLLNNEIVARQPRIHIDLKDNKILSDKDTSQIVLSIKYPNTEKYTIIPSKDYIITYNKNQASIEFLPKFTLDGAYTLRVQGKDRSGNTSGSTASNPYEVNFKIYTENAISTILPYPNPMTSQCKFAYTLTGDRPMVFKIQIMTVSGRIVRELTENDLGTLKEGTNLTERSWDGTDEYGNKLATGTYLYRIVMKDNTGKSYSSFESVEDPTTKAGNDARRFFTKGIGKLVILR